MKQYSISIALLVTLFASGCMTEYVSFGSPQLAFLRDQVFRHSDKGPQPEWVLHWLGERRPIYAVNVGNQVLFANESGDLLRFHGNQIVEVRSLLPGQKIVVIVKDETGLQYRVGGKSVGRHDCHSWEAEQMDQKSRYTSFIQRCSQGKKTWLNRIKVNSERKLVQLTFFVHPHYPPVRLELATQ